jgi:hypothetical protein
MLLVLGSALNLPLRERNVQLIAAGFAPVFEKLSWDDPALERVKQAVEHILRNQEPRPAMLRSYQGAQDLPSNTPSKNLAWQR